MSTPLSQYNSQKRQQKGFEEVNLPFDNTSEDKDYISGEELYEALISREVRDSMDDYNITQSQYDDEFEFKASRGSYLGFGESSYIAFEGELELGQGEESAEARHYHMRVELAAPDEETMDVLKQDLELLEEGLTDYYENNDSEAQLAGKQQSVAD